MTRSNKTYCVMCGKTTSWTRGYCPICVEEGIIVTVAIVSPGSPEIHRGIPITDLSATNDFRWNGRSFERVYLAPLAEAIVHPFSSNVAPEESQYVRTLSTLSTKVRLIAYNKFLSDVYCKPTRFSDLCRANGVLEAQISRWKVNFEWVHHFLTVFQVLLEARLNLIFENSNPTILCWVYGLDGEDRLETSIIADRLSISEYDVAHCSKRLIGFLSTSEGRKLIEETLTHVINALGPA